MPRSNALERQGHVRDVLNKVAAQTGAQALDTWSFLCPDPTCSTQGEQHPLYYRDGLHISVAEGRTLGPLFAHEIDTTDWLVPK